MPSIAIITARGGSKRIPGKNIKDFCGRPIICYSIEAALKSEIFSEVMVSTDCEKIAEISLKCGAKVPFLRSSGTSDDHSTTADVLKEVLTKYTKMGKEFKYACCIYPTAPFVTPEKLKQAFNMLVEKTADTVMPIVAYSFPPQRAVVIENGIIKPQYPEFQKCRSQDLKPIYHDCGQFYFMSVDSFMKNGTLIGDNTIPIIVDETEVQDIDNITDWKIAEMKYKLITEVRNEF